MSYGTFKQRREKHKYKQLKKAKHKREHEKHDEYEREMDGPRCGTKKIYATMSEAQINGRKRMQGILPDLYVYLCRTCGGWHLTRQNRATSYPCK